ncbi:Uncharacterised protein [Moraxella lacunata]|uniref:Lipoprotein n=1 Tax=Moraxella lacunata TaxID=477 RepID=A0A378TR65_MORLA|nr:hypothetical protein [Moraxella lacunata]STZ63359.1 Uncharacterised protein [Moraxella lacunata]
MKIIFIVIVFSFLTACQDNGINQELLSLKSNNKEGEFLDFSTVQCQKSFDLHEYIFPYECSDNCQLPYSKNPSFNNKSFFNELSIDKYDIDNWFFTEKVEKRLISSQEFSKDEDNSIFGRINYCNTSEIIYNFSPIHYTKNIRKDDIVYLKGHLNDIKFDELDRYNIYQIIRLGGENNPEKFFENLMNTPSLKGNYSCDIRQKEVPYGMVEMAYCAEYNKLTVITLYNPN